jgi:hypothetical protein
VPQVRVTAGWLQAACVQLQAQLLGVQTGEGPRQRDERTSWCSRSAHPAAFGGRALRATDVEGAAWGLRQLKVRL